MPKITKHTVDSVDLTEEDLKRIFIKHLGLDRTPEQISLRRYDPVSGDFHLTWAIDEEEIEL